MKYLKAILKYLPFFAIIFAIYYFYKEGILEKSIPKFDWALFMIGTFIYIIMMYIRSVIWKVFLKRFNINVSKKEAVISVFKTILTKYIPGKVWVFLSQGQVISEKGYSIKKVSLISILFQLISIISGIFVGFVGVLVFITSVLSFIYIILIIVVFLSLIVFFNKEREIPIFFAKKIVFRKYEIEKVNLPKISDLLVFLAIHWIILGLAFYFFFISFGCDFGLGPILLQPLANNIGILAFVFPSGIGVREGAMISYLKLLDVDFAIASSITIFSRIWTMVAEVIVFIIGLIISKKEIMSAKIK